MKSDTDISYVLRLKPGEDLKLSIQNFINENNIEAGWIVTCLGSLTTYAIRFANQHHTYTYTGYFEIISLSGTLSVNGSHLHISISDSNGKTIGGHLQKGCIIYTTAEIVLIKSTQYIFERKNDGITPWNELQIIKK